MTCFMAVSSSNNRHSPFKVNQLGLFMAFGGVFLVVIAILLVFRFVEAERERDMRAWQIRHGIIANSRRAAVEVWLEQQFSILTELADNASLQLYVDRLTASAGNIPEDVALVEGAYLRNLLEATAARGGFTGRMTGPEVDANVKRLGVAGIAVLDREGAALVTTRAIPPLTGLLSEAISRLPIAQRGLVDIYLGAGGTPTMGFAVPLFSVQGDRSTGDQIGTIIGFKEIADELYPLLVQPGNTTKTAESLLIRSVDSNIEYLSPLMDGTPPLKIKLAQDTPNLAAALAIEKSDRFGLGYDYRNQSVMFIARKMTTAPWTLVYKIDRAEALAASEDRLSNIAIVGGLLIAFVVAVIIGVWRWGASLRAERAMERYRKSSALFESILKFMRLLADYQPAEIFVVSSDGTYTFANQTAADKAGTMPQDMKGKTMTSVIGPVKAKAFGDVNKLVIRDFKKIDRVYHFDEPDGTQTYRASHTPLKGDENYPSGALVVVDDISQLIHDQEIRQNGMRQLMRALVVLLDHKDPYSTVHSAIVAKLASAVARELGLDEDECLTIDLAGNLINLGKAVVPSDVLLKREDLSKNEQKFLKDSMLVASDLVHSVEFGLPVTETLAQVRECWDGSGPLGLKGEQILLMSRLIAAANALVGLMSPRSHREALSYDEAINVLQRESGSHLGPKVVSAITNFVDNRGGMEIIKLIALANGERMSATQLIYAIDNVGK